MNMYLPYTNGWQFCSLTGIPGYAALTCAKMRRDDTLSASRLRLLLFHAGRIDVNTAGSGSPSLYQPTPKPSPFRLAFERCWMSWDWRSR